MAELLTTVYLPSKGRLNLDNPAYGGPIDLDMIGFEQELMIFGSNAENHLDKMLQSVIKTDGVNVNELTSQDRFFLLVQERIHSYGSDYHISYRCPVCGQVEEHILDLNNVALS